MPLVLVIDDDPQMRATMRRMLTSSGHTVIEACDGHEGLAAFRARAPDVVVTDIVMPEQEGFQTIIELRRATRRAKILAVSGSWVAGEIDFLAMAKRLGADLVMQKPFRAAELQKAVNRLATAAATDSSSLHDSVTTGGATAT